MKRLIGVLLLVVAIILGFYVGGWLLFCKPIAELVGVVTTGAETNIAAAIFKIGFGTFIVEAISGVFGWIGIAMIIFSD